MRHIMRLVGPIGPDQQDEDSEEEGNEEDYSCNMEENNLRVVSAKLELKGLVYNDSGSSDEEDDIPSNVK